MKIIAIIPARLAATRFPNKPMAMICGIPMIGHCYVRTLRSPHITDVYVATCDLEIADYIHSIGGKAILTSNTHERATERIAEGLINIENELKDIEFDIVVMVQGDEPLIQPDMLIEVIQPLTEGKHEVSNLMSALTTGAEMVNPNNVKVVTRLDGSALYMSREPIPSNKKFSGNIPGFRQLGLIAFTRDALKSFVSLEMTPLEIIESVDMNRFLENGISIKMVETKFSADSVDTPDDLIRVERAMEVDPIFNEYKALYES